MIAARRWDPHLGWVNPDLTFRMLARHTWRLAREEPGVDAKVELEGDGQAGYDYPLGWPDEQGTRAKPRPKEQSYDNSYSRHLKYVDAARRRREAELAKHDWEIDHSTRQTVTHNELASKLSVGSVEDVAREYQTTPANVREVAYRYGIVLN